MEIVDALIRLAGPASLLAACLVLLFGNWLGRRVPLLARYSIPSPIVGGVLFALGAMLVQRSSGYTIETQSVVKTELLLTFFACLGLSSDLRQLVRGGPRLVRFLLALAPFLVVQNLLGVLLAKVLGLHGFLGLVAGTITLVGGHGTGAAYVARFDELVQIPGLMALTMTSATLGLVLGGVVGGPVAERLIRRHRLTAAHAEGGEETGSVINGPEADEPVSTFPVIGALAIALIAMLIGQWLASQLQGLPIAVPAFVLCLLAGLAMRNLGEPLGLKLHQPSVDLIGSVSLSLFLAWTMMALDLSAVIAMAGPLVLILLAQVVLVALWAYFITFRAVGRDYESAVMSAAFCGFALGATATAIANMQALARRHGPAPQAFLVVPIVGAFFVDLMNMVVLTGFLGWLGLR